MKHIYELDKGDIVQVLANYYNCDTKDVELTVEPFTVVEGDGQHTEYHPIATIKIKSKASKVGPGLSQFGIRNSPLTKEE